MFMRFIRASKIQIKRARSCALGASMKFGRSPKDAAERKDYFKSSLGGSSPNHFTYILVNSPLDEPCRWLRQWLS